jgi:excisionase family DNA binding protein
MDRHIVSVPEAAGLLGVSDDLVYELTERGDLPCIRLGRRKLIPRTAIEALVERAITCSIRRWLEHRQSAARPERMEDRRRQTLRGRHGVSEVSVGR